MKLYGQSTINLVALALTLFIGGGPAAAQDTYSYDNFQNAPPGAFLNNKVKPATTAAKPPAHAAVKKPVAKAAAKPVTPKAGVYNSGQMIPGDSFNYPAQNQLGQSGFTQPQSGDQNLGTSGWVTPNTLGNQQDNSYPQQTQTPFDNDVEIQQSFAPLQNNSGGGGTSSSGWVNPGQSNDNGGAMSGGGMSSSGWVNPSQGNFGSSGGNSGGMSSSGWVNPSQGNFNSGGNSGGTSSSGWVNPSQGNVGSSGGGGDMTNSVGGNTGISSSGWVTPGGGKGKGSNKPIKQATRPVQQQQQQQPTQSQQWSQPQGGSQAPLFGQVLEQEQGNSGGNMQGTAATGGAGGMTAQNPPDMPAGGFTVSPDAAVMPGMMNMLMNMQQQNGGGQRAAAQQRPAGFSTPPMVRGMTNQVGRTVNRAVNRSVNQMLYRGLNSLRF